MGKIGNGLYKSLKKNFLNFVQQKRKTYGRNKTKACINNAHGNGVSDCFEESNIVKKEFKPTKPDPLLIGKRPRRPVILKRHGPAPKGYIGEQYDVKYNGQTHIKELPLSV